MTLRQEDAFNYVIFVDTDDPADIEVIEERLTELVNEDLFARAEAVWTKEVV